MHFWQILFLMDKIQNNLKILDWKNLCNLGFFILNVYLLGFDHPYANFLGDGNIPGNSYLVLDFLQHRFFEIPSQKKSA